ncbi:MAG: hypothetical protein ABWY17_07810, partial [Pseudomonas sp.]
GASTLAIVVNDNAVCPDTCGVFATQRQQADSKSPAPAFLSGENCRHFRLIQMIQRSLHQQIVNRLFSPVSDLHIRSPISRRRAKEVDEDEGFLVHGQPGSLKEMSESFAG